MNLCDDGHDEVCFEVRNCPCCDKLKEISDLEDKIYNLTKEISDLKEGE